jgi:hypothetical protein
MRALPEAVKVSIRTKSIDFVLQVLAEDKSIIETQQKSVYMSQSRNLSPQNEPRLVWFWDKYEGVMNLG